MRSALPSSLLHAPSSRCCISKNVAYFQSHCAISFPPPKAFSFLVQIFRFSRMLSFLQMPPSPRRTISFPLTALHSAARFHCNGLITSQLVPISSHFHLISQPKHRTLNSATASSPHHFSPLPVASRAHL